MKKKLIEVALPLAEINDASGREKSIRHGHPSTLHLWWARRPLATARAVLFASLIDDPSEHEEKFPTVESQEAERKRLFKIIADLVKWENTANEEIFSKALDEIKKSCGENIPAVFDPFAGGGTIPLEAQRLGLKSFANDLNPVAVMINKAMIEIPAQFKNSPPINPDAKNSIGNQSDWHGANGLAEDIRYYGKLLKTRAWEKLKNLYPKIDGKTVIAWLWARTVTCSNPTCQHKMPLAHSFKLSTKQNIFAEPVIEGDNIKFNIKHGKPTVDGTVNKNGAHCLFCGANVPLEHIRSEGKNNNLSAKLMAIVAEGENGRIYLPPNDEHEKASDIPKPDEFLGELPDKALGFRVQEYGITEWQKLFTNRQLTALTTFSELISEIKSQVQTDGGTKNYSDAIAVYLAFLVDKLVDYGNSNCMWSSTREIPVHIFGRQAISMQWDCAEANPFSNSSGCFDNMLDWIYKSVKNLPAKTEGAADLHSALQKFSFEKPVMVSTDPPYYDNIGYANLSEFFYVWLRRPLKNIYPKLFGRMNFAKGEEIIAEPARFEGNKTAAKNFFEDGMFEALKNIYEISREDFPTTIYYAFKQQDSETDGAASTGWETMLAALIRAGFQITATLPMRTEMKSRMRSHESNALASSIVLACRKRPLENKICGKNEFVRELKAELKNSLSKMRSANIAPVDMAQAAIGPGIGIYSRYEKITDMNDNELSVRDALKMINAEVAEILGNSAGKTDAATQFCTDLFIQKCWDEISFGEADVLARAKNISVGKLEEIGAVISSRGRVRLVKREELDLVDEKRQLNKNFVKKLSESKCAWLWLQSLVKVFGILGVGENKKSNKTKKEERKSDAGELLAKFEGNAESLKNLAYLLYDVCEKKSWAKEGGCYNEIVMEWQDILNSCAKYFSRETDPAPEQGNIFQELTEKI